MKSVIEIENVSKIYRLGKVGMRTLRDDIKRFASHMLGRESPLIANAQVNDRSRSDRQSDFVWALKDVSFTVAEGETLGIVGRNGAGKSTLLKLLSRITSPTSGFIRSKGRISTLLEVGTGFHPELTGRENIFLNGSILGMRRQEIARQLDSIVEFSGCALYLDTPVKRYSSGMTVRLGFAVAAHLQCEIMIVDEVLAVGDSEFQKKCLAKMREVGRNGRTVLFVSHSMAAVRSLCDTVVLLSQGQFAIKASVEEGLKRYMRDGTAKDMESLSSRTDREGDGRLRWTSAYFTDCEGLRVDEVISGDEISIVGEFRAVESIELKKVVFAFSLIDEYGTTVADFISDELSAEVRPPTETGRTLIARVRIPGLFIRGGRFSLRMFSSYEGTSKEQFLDVIENTACLNVLSRKMHPQGKLTRDGSSALLPATLQVGC